MKRQPSNLVTGTFVLMILAVVMAVLSGDMLLVLAVGSAIAGVMVLSRPSQKNAAVHVAVPRFEAAEMRRVAPPERAAVHRGPRSAIKRQSVVAVRRTLAARNRQYAVASDSSFPVIQVLR
jgi:hypothetical protein